ADVGKDIKPENIDTSGMRMWIDPREEWAQIFDEAWRMQQQFFYAENLHGIDWDAVYEKYRPLLPHVGRREDLNALMIEMIAELQAGHNRVGGGDIHRESGVSVGLLGANFAIENGRYRLARIYSGESWNPFLRGPLTEPGNEAREGEYLLAINGRDLTGRDNIFRELHDTADKQVTLTVGPRADGRDSRDIVVTPTGSENALRLWNWIETNRRQVAEATDGRVGYIYLPNTAGAGYTFFNRMFFSQIDKEALIIDERANGGGQAANYITEVLSRRHLSTWRDRAGMPYNTPAGALHGPKVMMIDQDAGSGGDYLPYSFRHLGIGKLLGTRTWGGLIGISANPPLIDGGGMTVPFFRFVDADGNWSVENEGVAPDIEVKLDPVATNRGRDTQLEAAIDHILSELEDYESPVPP
ncbi:MAG: PDZ domain-containing protein, partial [Wenzhouxiangellaceae bacterium]